MTKKVCLYCRVSTTDRQDVNRQVNELKEVVDNNGWILTDIYIDEGFSRSTTTRPELDRMMKDAFSKKFEMYFGVENLTNFKQKNPILASDNPFSANFDSTIIYGSIFGRMFYSGLRFKID